MTTMVQGYADDEAQAKAALTTSNSELASLLAPLPSTTEATTATQSKLAEMGKELPWSTRQAELKALADTVKRSVEDNKKKINDAEVAAAAKP